MFELRPKTLGHDHHDFSKEHELSNDIFFSKDGVVVCFQRYVPQIDCLATPADVN